MAQPNQKKPVNNSYQTNTNPFARALAETEQSAFDTPAKYDQSLFSDAMARAGGPVGPMGDSVPNADFSKYQQEEKERIRKKELLKRKLHDRINNTNQELLFNSREKRVLEELEKTRKEIDLLSKDIAKLNSDVSIAAFQEIVNPGQDGRYYVSFFQQLRAFIMFLRQKVKSAATWATQLGAKAKKKQSMNANAQKGHARTKTIFDTMHHEVATARSGG